MRRILAIALIVGAAGTLALFGAGAGDDGGSYKVRAIFNNAANVIPGEDVKIAGVKVGKIASLDVTSDQKAAIVLDITNKGFQDFRSDATCIIRPQSLIGEKFVECVPTQPRPVGAAPAPRLRKIERGRGKGQYLLPARNTVTPVDLDLINNVFRLPYAQRFSIILNEFGTALAGRGRELNDAIRKANPALREFDEVLAILARQNRVLADLARDSDQIMAPLARDRREVADFIVQANETAQATAERRAALEANIERFPTFLRELKPTMVRLGALSDEMTPVLRDLRAVAPDLNRFIIELGPFSEASREALPSLGAAADVGSEALPATRPLIRDLRKFAKRAEPVSDNLSAILTSLQKTGGIERLMDFIFYQVSAINGFDSFGHYLRAGLLVNSCVEYATEPVPGCSANFTQAEESSARSAGNRDARTQAMREVLRGASAEEALEKYGLPSVTELFARPQRRDESSRRPRPRSRRPAIGLPSLPLIGGAQAAPRSRSSRPERPRRSTRAERRRGWAPPDEQETRAREAARNGLFDYLLGGER